MRSKRRDAAVPSRRPTRRWMLTWVLAGAIGISVAAACGGGDTDRYSGETSGSFQRRSGFGWGG